MCKDGSHRFEKWAAKSFRSALVLLLTPILYGPAAVAQSGPTFHSSGDFASGSFCSQSGTNIECITVNVFAAGGPTAIQKQMTTFLAYDDFIVDVISGIPIQETDGNGQILNSAFQVHGKTDSVNVDTSKVPNFFNEFCTFPSGSRMCNPAPGGIVTGTWNEITNQLNFQFSGTTREVSPAVILISTGTDNDKPALTSLSVLGVVVPNAAGDMGQQHNTIITVQRP